MYRSAGRKGSGSWRSRAWYVYLLGGLLVTSAFSLTPSADVQFVLRFLLVVSALAAFVTGILLHRPGRPLPWYLFAFGLLMPILGTLTLAYCEVALRTAPPFPSVADAFFIASYPWPIAALLLMQARRLFRDQASVVDPLIISVGAGMLSWVFLMKPYTQDPSLSLPQQVVSIAYPLMDLLLLTVVLRMLLAPGERPFAFYPLILGLGSTLAFDAAYALTTLSGTYEDGSPMHVLELTFFVLLGVTALHPSMVDLSDRTADHAEARLTWPRLASLAVASLMAPAVLALQAVRGETIDVPVIVGGSAVLFLLVLSRMAGMMRSRERSIARERTLRNTAAALVTAADRESIHEVALNSVRSLTDKASNARVAIATGSPGAVTVVAALGDNADEAVGARIYLGEYPDAIRTGLIEGRVVEAERLHEEDGSEALLGFDPGKETACFVPLLVQARLRGVILVVTRSALLEDNKATLGSIGSEVSLALESVALTEEVHRREGEERFRSLVQNSSDVVSVVGPDGVVSYVSPAVERILGYKPEGGVGLSIFRPPVTHPDDVDRLREIFGLLSRSPGSNATADFRLRHADGRWVRVEATMKNLLADPLVGGVVVNYRDVTERKALEEQLRHQAFHDPLTDLPNRALFMDRLEHALDRAERRRGSLAVLFMDLDNFKLVNDSLGHEAGDRLLVLFAKRLRECFGPEDTVARLGGDEFTVLLEDVEDSGDAVRAADRIARVLKASFVLDSHEVFVTTSVGVSLTTHGRKQPSQLMRDADMALYRAKESGKASCEVFDAAMDSLVAGRLDLEADMRRGIERKEFEVHYQPQLVLTTGRISGWEALVRWRHPGRDLIPPCEFLTIAEETGLITRIGSLVLEEACRQAKEWQDLQPSAATPVRMSVNVSARQFQRSNELVRDVERVLEKTGLPPNSLVLEITESMVMGDAEHNTTTLQRLKKLGVRLAVDDFGTGYSNLAYLKRFPVDYLKVDRSFVGGLGENPEDTAIVEAVVGLARALDVEVIPEGIETTGQLHRLQALGCQVGQGYYFSKPLSAREASALLPAPSAPTPGHEEEAEAGAHDADLPGRSRCRP